MQASFASSLTIWHTREGRTDGGGDAAGTTTRAALHGYGSLNVLRIGGRFYSPSDFLWESFVAAQDAHLTGTGRCLGMSHQLLQLADVYRTRSARLFSTLRVATGRSLLHTPDRLLVMQAVSWRAVTHPAACRGCSPAAGPMLRPAPEALPDRAPDPDLPAPATPRCLL